ncbi:MAG: DUF2752 domain-containing protein [Fimbriiglobus sp.]
MGQTVNVSSRFLVRGGVIAIAAILLGALLWGVATFPPTEYSFYPQCTLHRFTGLHCTGCGFTRSLSSTAQGDFSQAFAYNPILPLIAPYFLMMGCRSAVRWVRGITPTIPRVMPVNRWVVRALVTLMILFTLLRNVPVEPFTILAPHQLQR